MSLQYGELRLRSVGKFGAPQQISTDFASWLRYFCDLINSIQQRSPRTFGWAVITLDIGQHSIFYLFKHERQRAQALIMIIVIITVIIKHARQQHGDTHLEFLRYT